MREDPWVSIRTKKYMAGPKRVAFKNLATLKSQYRLEFSVWFLIGAAAAYPFALFAGRRAQRYQGGVAVVPIQRYVDEWPNVHANRTTNKFFRRYAIGTCVSAGMLLGFYMADDSVLNNEYYTRPDLKPFPAMVDQPNDYDQEAYKQLLEKNYAKYAKAEQKKSPLYRLLWPNHADFTPKTNRFVNRDSFRNYNYESGAFPTTNHSYADHRI